jgi:hypothetical protein
MIAQFAPSSCRCPECRQLDRAHPTEGTQLSLMPEVVPVALPIPLTPTAPEITALLRRTRMRVANEAALQTSIEDALVAAAVPYAREHRLSPADRIDFLCGRIGIEAKARYNKRATYRQLERYAAHDAIDALILVTGTAMGLPAEIGGKPVYIVSTGRASL